MLAHDAAGGVWRSSLLDAWPWLEHGFGGQSPVDWPPPHAAATKQVHGADVLKPSTAGECGEGDALVTNVAGLWVGVRTADCVPILLVDVRRRVVAAVHAGWRGTVAEVVRRALEQMGSDPGDVYAALGPSIGVCCYEVGPEVASHFAVECVRTEAGCRLHLDLIAANRQQLLYAGVPGAQIDAAPPCTFCSPGFHSFRRDGAAAGRMVSAIRVRC